jgi:hypothetical protein
VGLIRGSLDRSGERHSQIVWFLDLKVLLDIRRSSPHVQGLFVLLIKSSRDVCGARLFVNGFRRPH